MFTKIKSCAVCDDNNLATLWDLPQLPLTERFGAYQPERCPPIDQQLLFCLQCGHVQLAHQVKPEILYNEHYAFRTSSTQATQKSALFFIEFIKKYLPKQKEFHLMDIGGNDLFLAKNMGDYFKNKNVVDPILATQDGSNIDGIEIIGKKFEDAIGHKDFSKINVVVCRHTLEHIANPKLLLQNLFEACSEDATYFFEIPSFDNLVKNNRFDAIFHQHYHYFGLNSFLKILQQCGGAYLTHYDYLEGPCGGSLMIAFRQGNTTPVLLQETSKQLAYYQQKIAAYSESMKKLGTEFKQFKDIIYGYGASLMLATLAYHLKSDLSMLSCILDDDPGKDGMTYQNIPVKICLPSESVPQAHVSYLVTSLENQLAITNKIKKLLPNKIFIPGWDLK